MDAGPMMPMPTEPDWVALRAFALREARKLAAKKDAEDIAQDALLDVLPSAAKGQAWLRVAIPHRIKDAMNRMRYADLGLPPALTRACYIAARENTPEGKKAELIRHFFGRGYCADTAERNADTILAALASHPIEIQTDLDTIEVADGDD